MADQSQTFALLSALETIDVQEDGIVSELLRRGAELEESERRSRMVTVAELRALRSGLTSLEAAIDALQEGVVRAEAAAVTPKPANGNGANGAPKAPQASSPAAAAAPAEPAPKVPEPPPTFEELAAHIRDHDAAGAELRAKLRERFSALGHEPSAVAGPGTAADAVAVPVPVALTVPDAGRGIAGTQAVPARPTFRLTKPPMASDEIKAFQDVLNHRFDRWEIGLGVREDGVYGPATRTAARRVARGLGIAPQDYAHGITPAVRDLMRNPSGRTAEQLGRAQDHAAWLKALRRGHNAGGAAGGGHAHARNAHAGHVHGPARATTTPRKPVSRPRPARGALEAAIAANGGRYADIIVREARAQRVPVSLVCAVLQKESRFRNVFGHDGVANPIKSPPGGLLEVTEANYRDYLRHRNRGEGPQGVGPMQLTWPAFQDEADTLGGCWKVGPNIKVGVGVLARNIDKHGTHDGVRLYNGSNQAAERYAVDVLKLERVWRERLAGLSPGASGKPSPGGPSRPAPAGPRAPRVFRVTRKPMSGTDIKTFQDVLNRRMERWGVDLRVEEDGVYGPATKLMARRVARGLGIDPADYARGMTPRVRSVIRNPRRRTPAQIARARQNRAWKLALAKRYAVGKPGTAGRQVKGDGSYPLARRGKFNGGPFVGTHRKGNWQSDNAVDLNTPVGTPMLSMDDGIVEKVRHRPQDNSGLAGDQITIRGDRGNAYFYTHGVAAVKAGQRVRRGQVLGTSGSAGVPHLHFAVKKGDPRQIIGQFK